MNRRPAPQKICVHCGQPYNWHTEQRHRPHKRTGEPRCLRKRPDGAPHRALVDLACRWLKRQRCTVVFAEPTMSLTHAVDAIGWRHGRSLVVECKCSLGDLKRELHKAHWRAGVTLGDERYILPELVDKAEPLMRGSMPGWGLLSATPKSAHIVFASAPWEMSRNALHEERYLLAQAVRRHELGIPWKPRERRFVPYFEHQLQRGDANDRVVVEGGGRAGIDHDAHGAPADRHHPCTAVVFDQVDIHVGARCE